MEKNSRESRKVKETLRPKSLRAQSALEYMVIYGWAILLIVLIISVLYLYLNLPISLPSTACNFIDGVSCRDIIVSTNSTSKTSEVVLYLTNTQQTPIISPSIYLRSGNLNSTAFNCFPSYVLPGGTIICTITESQASYQSSLLAGTLYLNATTCGLSALPTSPYCTSVDKVKEVFVGSFTGQVSSQKPNLVLSFLFNATNYTQRINKPVVLKAIVGLGGKPFSGATVNFTVSNSTYHLSPRATLTNDSGIAITSLTGNPNGHVVVTAHFAGLSNSLTIYFNSQQSTTTTSTTTTTTTAISSSILPSVPSIVLDISPQAAASSWGLCLQYLFPNGTYQPYECVGNESGFSGSENVIDVPSGTIINYLCLSNVTPSNYGFQSWLPSNSGPYYTGSQCNWWPYIPITQPYYILAGLQQQNNITSQTYPIYLIQNPANASNYWNLCITYHYPNFQNDQPKQCIGGSNDSTSSNVIYVPKGSIIDYICTTEVNGGNYGLSGWSGSFTDNESQGSCNRGTYINVTGPTTIQANYALQNFNGIIEYPITLEQNPAAVDNYWNLCINFNYPGLLSSAPQECTGNFSGWNGSVNTIYVPNDTKITFICTGGQWPTWGGDYGFTGWSGTFHSNYSCNWGTSLNVTGPTTIEANYANVSNNLPTYQVTLNENPADASNYWGSCIEYNLSGFLFSEPETCVGDGQSFTGASNVINVPANSLITYICTDDWNGGDYQFINWTGSFDSPYDCNWPSITVNGPMTLQSNFYNLSGVQTTSTTSTVGSSTTTIYTSTSTQTTTTISYVLTMECNGPVNQNCGISPIAGIQYSYPAGSIVNISASRTTQAIQSECGSAYAAFVGWSGGGYNGNSLNASFSITSDMTETATYKCS